MKISVTIRHFSNFNHAYYTIYGWIHEILSTINWNFLHKHTSRENKYGFIDKRDVFFCKLQCSMQGREGGVADDESRGGGGFKWWKDNFKIGCSKFAFRKVIKVEGPYAPPSQLVASSKQFYLVLQGWCFGLVFFLAVVVFSFLFKMFPLSIDLMFHH